MKPDWLAAYEKLALEIDQHLARQGPPIEKMEACFMTALAHWEHLKENIKKHEFDSDQEEIIFFKTIKPRFTGLVEYYNQCYQALLFLPDSGPAAALYFWKMELRRIQRSFELHAEFIQYYEQGNTDLDETYFLRVYSDLSNFEKARVYDLDEQTASSHDWLISKLIGLRMYREDVEKAIGRLE
jgi:hypothetical protein